MLGAPGCKSTDRGVEMSDAKRFAARINGVSGGTRKFWLLTFAWSTNVIWPCWIPCEDSEPGFTVQVIDRDAWLINCNDFRAAYTMPQISMLYEYLLNAGDASLTIRLKRNRLFRAEWHIP